MWDFEWIRLGCEVDLERFADSSFFHAAFAEPSQHALAQQDGYKLEYKFYRSFPRCFNIAFSFT